MTQKIIVGFIVFIMCAFLFAHFGSEMMSNSPTCNQINNTTYHCLNNMTGDIYNQSIEEDDNQTLRSTAYSMLSILCIFIGIVLPIILITTGGKL